MSDLDHNSKMSTTADKLSQKRRALIKGSAIAIPAILTLRSGSALAATSISCVTKVQATNPAAKPDTAVSDPAVDTWLRQSTDCRELSRRGSRNVTVFRDPNTPLTPEADAKWYSTAANNTNVAIAYVNKPGPDLRMLSNNGVVPIREFIYTATSTCYVLVKVDPTGSQPNLKVYGAFTSASLNSESCATSLISHPA